MDLPDGIYAIPQTQERNGTEITYTPAAVATPKGLVLVDVGFEGNLDQLAANLGDIDRGWDDVHAVVLTHHDTDHAEALEQVVDRTDATVYAHERAAPYVDGRKHPIKGDDDDRYPPVAVDVELVDGVSFRTDAGPMEVVYTPGHTPGHVSLYFPEQRVLIAGDAVTADAEGLARPKEKFTPDMDRALESVDDLAELDVDSVLCYHGGFVEAGTERLEELTE